MNKYLFYILIALFPLSLPAQVLDTMYFDKAWEQTSREESHYYRYISIDTTGNFRFYVQDFFPDGTIQMTGTYKSIRPDNKDGHFVYYYENGQKQMECHYKNNVLDGVLREWYESGQEESYQEFRNGMLDGEFRSWRKDGSMKLNAVYHEGAKHGLFQSYYTNGNPVREDYFEYDRLLEGKCFSEEGDQIEYFPYVRMPEYPGGREELYRFVRKELKYPQEAKKRGQQGAVLILFTVDEKGNVKDPRIIKEDLESFNEEAIRVVNRLPKWTPGEVDGIPSPIQVTVPIEFRLR